MVDGPGTCRSGDCRRPAQYRVTLVVSWVGKGSGRQPQDRMGGEFCYKHLIRTLPLLVGQFGTDEVLEVRKLFRAGG